MRSVLLLGVVLAGCAAAQPSYMRPAAAPAPSCSADAYVVFVRPGRSGSMLVELREADGTFLGEVEDDSYFGVPVAPGEHFFIARIVGYKDSRPIALKAQLEGGRTYFVDVEIFHKFPILYAVAPRHGYWNQLAGWMAASHRLEPDPAAGTPPAPEPWADAYNYVREWYAALDDQSIAERKLIASDGSLEPSAYASPGTSCSNRPARPAPMVAAAAPLLPAEDIDVPRCRTEMPVGSHMRTQVCKTERQLQEERDSAWRYMNRPRIRPDFFE